MTSPSPRIVNIKGDTKPADRCDVETLKGANLRIRFRWGDDEFRKRFFSDQKGAYSKGLKTMVSCFFQLHV